MCVAMRKELERYPIRPEISLFVVICMISSSLPYFFCIDNFPFFFFLLMREFVYLRIFFKKAKNSNNNNFAPFSL